MVGVNENVLRTYSCSWLVFKRLKVYSIISRAMFNDDDALVFLKKTLAREEVGRTKARARHGMISATVYVWFHPDVSLASPRIVPFA